MLFDVVITPFQPLPDCSTTDFEYGDFNCTSLYNKIISMRVYFVVILFNFIFIVTTTCYFIYRVLKAKWTNYGDICQDNISKRWQEYSLKKRGLFGSVLGAMGHLIFSTSILSYQTLVEPWTCSVYLWGSMLGFYTWAYAIIWRSVRLYVLIRLNNLQKRYLRIPFQANDPRKDPNDNDYKWFIKQKDRLNINTSHHIYIYSTTIVLLIVIIVLVETLIIGSSGTARCSLDWGSNMMMGLAVFFVVVVVSAIGWLLKDYEDAHGIRLEIWVTLLVGIPCFVAFIIWQCVFESPNLNKNSVRNLYGPGNWILFVTTTNHIMSIVLPTFKTLSIQRKSKTKPNRKKHNSVVVQKARNVCRISMLRPPEPKNAGPSIPILSSLSLPGLVRNPLRLTTEALEENLCDPYMRGVLREWAIKDFSVENVLFYEFYLHLVQKVHHYKTKDTLNKINKANDDKLDIVESQEKLKPSRSIELQERSTPYIPSPSTLSPKDIFSIPTPQDISTTFPLDAIPEFLDFYNTFIKENAPLQVNISHKARGKIDQVFEPLDLPSSPPYAFDIKPSRSFFETISPCSFPNSPQDEKNCIFQSSLDMSALNSICISLQSFEAARKEVFWNIFAGVYPRVVDAYSS